MPSYRRRTAGNLDCNPNTNADPFCNRDRDPDGDCNPNANADPVCVCDRDVDFNPNTNADPVCNRNGDTDVNPNSNADIYNSSLADPFDLQHLRKCDRRVGPRHQRSYHHGRGINDNHR